MVVLLGRLLYTQYKHRNRDTAELSLASNAHNVLPEKGEDLPPSYSTTVLPLQESKEHQIEVNVNELNKEITPEANLASAHPLNNYHSDPRRLSDMSIDSNTPISIFPQYLAEQLTTLIIQEDPTTWGAFTIYRDSVHPSNELFRITRTAKCSNRLRTLTDARTGAPILSIRREMGTLPRSFVFLDPRGEKILDLHGCFYTPRNGSRASGFFLNAVDGKEVELAVQGGKQNRQGSVVDARTGRCVASLESRWEDEGRGCCHAKRVFTAYVHAGVDCALMAGLIVALDPRAKGCC